MIEPLAGIRVVEVAQGIAAAFCGMVLASQGADVVRVEPNDDPARRRRLVKTRSGAQVSPLFLHLNAGKRSVRMDPGNEPAQERLRSLLRTADVVLDDGLAAVYGLNDLREEARGARIVATITPYGSFGPKAGWAGSSLTLAASGAALSMAGDPDREPLKLAGHQPEKLSGLIAFIGIASALRLPRAEHPHALELATADVVAGNLEDGDLLFSMFGAVRKRFFGRMPGGYPWDILPCKDGAVHLNLAHPTPEGGMAILMGRPDLADNPIVRDARLRIEHPEWFDDFVRDWLMTHTRDEVVHAAQELRMPFAAVNTMADLLEEPQLNHRRFFTEVEHQIAGKLQHPGGPWIVEGEGWLAGPAPGVGDGSTAQWHPRVPRDNANQTTTPAASPLAGVRVVDLTMVYAGPTGTRVLADLGADVIKVESTTRLDLSRMLCLPGNRAAEEDYWNHGGYYLTRNLGKRAITLDLSRPQGREVLTRLVRDADLLVEAYTPRVMTGWGMGFEKLREINPRLVMVSMSGYGQTGPQSNWVAYGTVLESAAGICGLTGYPGGGPRRSGMAYLDVTGGLTVAAAAVTGLCERDRTGQGLHIDLALRDTGIPLIAEYVIERQITGREPERIGNWDPDFAPHGVYRCAGEDQWVAIAVTSEAMWAGLMSQPGLTHLREDPRFASMHARVRNREALDAEIAIWTSGQLRHELADALQRVGVDAAAVHNNKEVLLDPHFRARCVFTMIDHTGVGPRPFARNAPLWIDGMPVRPERRAPRLGEHNVEVLRSAGYDDGAIQALGDSSIIGDSPAMVLPPEQRARFGFHVEALVRQGVFRMDPHYREELESYTQPGSA